MTSMAVPPDFEVLCDCGDPLVEAKACERCGAVYFVEGDLVRVRRLVNIVTNHPGYNFVLKL